MENWTTFEGISCFGGSPTASGEAKKTEAMNDVESSGEKSESPTATEKTNDGGSPNSSDDDASISFLLKKVEEVERRLEASERKHKETEKLLENIGDKTKRSSALPWQRTSESIWGAVDDEEGQEGEDNDAEKEDAFQLPMDMYSVVASWNIKSSPFIMSLLVIFGLQLGMLVLLMIDRIPKYPDDEENPLNLPVNVESEVRISQGLAMVVALFCQNDLRVGIEGIIKGVPEGFNSESSNFKHMTGARWNLANLLRFVQGLLGLVASFVLVIQADNVFDVLLNFLGVEFVSNLDDLFFELGMLGYLGAATKRCTKTISEAMFRREKSEGSGTSWCKRSAHIIGVFAVLATMLGSFSYFVLRQGSGEYSVHNILLEFGDQTLSSLGVFSGCYTATSSGKLFSWDSFAGRLVYSQSKDGSPLTGGTFAYCSDLNAWTFYDSATQERCKDFLIKSEETKTFNILDAGNKMQWTTSNDLPLDFLQITKVSKDGTCGYSKVFEASVASCEELELQTQTELLYFEKLSFNKADTDLQDPTVTHGIFVEMGYPKNVTDPRIVLFTGSRWVVTYLGHLSNATNTEFTSVSSIEDFFYLNKLFQVQEQVGQQWISLVSEGVFNFNDQGTALGLTWYYPKYEEEEEGEEVFFPSADLARPYGGIFTCARCNSVSNPCLYGGTCNDETGICACVNGAGGQLCQEKPLGNGECNPYFNTAEYNYDGGDCCASTCKGASCGVVSTSNLYGLENIQMNWEVAGDLNKYTSDMGVVATSSFARSYDCEDPTMARLQLTIEGFYDSGDIYLGGFELRCIAENGITSIGEIYLGTPVLKFADSSLKLVETISVPYGAECELRHKSPCFATNAIFPPGYSISLEYIGPTENVEIQKFTLDDCVEFSADIFRVPASQCLTNLLLGETGKEAFESGNRKAQAMKTLSADGFSDFECQNNPEDLDFFKERFFLALFDNSVSLKSVAFDIHQCRGWGSPAITLRCDDDDKRIVAVTATKMEGGNNDHGGTIPTELAYLSGLQRVDLTAFKEPKGFQRDPSLVNYLPPNLQMSASDIEYNFGWQTTSNNGGGGGGDDGGCDVFNPLGCL